MSQATKILDKIIKKEAQLNKKEREIQTNRYLFLSPDRPLSVAKAYWFPFNIPLF